MIPPYQLLMPARRTTGVVFSSPHSGRDYPADFLERAELDELAIRSSEDAFVDLLFSSAPDHGAPFLTATFPRAYVDLNRAPDEFDPALIEGLMRPAHNPRISSGLGVIPRVVANGRHIYRGKITLNEAHERITSAWRPWHDRLQALMDEAVRDFGQAVLIDCHSMPHEALENVGPIGAARPQVVLGDRFGAAASAWIVDRVEQIFARAGFRVARNMPFAGAFVAQNYGRPSRCQHVVQIEIDRALYLDERQVQPSGDFARFQKVMSGIVAELAAIGVPENGRMAAE